jgi:hypothetical protein
VTGPLPGEPEDRLSTDVQSRIQPADGSNMDAERRRKPREPREPRWEGPQDRRARARSGNQRRRVEAQVIHKRGIVRRSRRELADGLYARHDEVRGRVEGVRDGIHGAIGQRVERIERDIAVPALLPQPAIESIRVVCGHGNGDR